MTTNKEQERMRNDRSAIWGTMSAVVRSNWGKPQKYESEQPVSWSANLSDMKQSGSYWAVTLG